MAFQPGRQSQYLGVGRDTVCLDGDDPGLSQCQRAGLVESKHPDARQGLEHAGVADEAAVARQSPDTERSRQRRGEADGAGTGDHQNRHAHLHGVVERQPLRPVSHGQGAEHQHAGHGSGDGAVGQALDRAALHQRVAHRPADLCPTRSGPAAAAADQHQAFHVDTAGNHRRAEALLDRPALAGNDRFIGVGCALDDDAVHRDAFARPHPHQRPGDDVAHRAATLRTILHHDDVFAFRRQQRLEIAGRARPPGRLQIAAEGEQHQHHGGGVEIDLRVAVDDRQGRIDVGRADPEHDQRRGGQPAARGFKQGLAQKRTAEDCHRRGRQHHEENVDIGDEPRVGAGEDPAINEQAEQHDVHGQKAADAEADQKPRGLPFLGLAILDLKGDRAAVAAERAAFAIDGLLQGAWAHRQQTVAAKALARRGHTG